MTSASLRSGVPFPVAYFLFLTVGTIKNNRILFRGSVVCCSLPPSVTPPVIVISHPNHFAPLESETFA